VQVDSVVERAREPMLLSARACVCQQARVTVRAAKMKRERLENKCALMLQKTWRTMRLR
jgi:hypothetical protein